MSPRDDYPTYPYHPDCLDTMIAQLDIVGRQIARVSFRPCYINPAGQPVPLVGDDERFYLLMTYVREITAEAGYATRIHASGDDLVGNGVRRAKGHVRRLLLIRDAGRSVRLSSERS